LSLPHQHLAKIEEDFATGDVERAKSQLARITIANTWDSEHNLNNAIGAILALSKGDLAELSKLVDAALIDFRDVIYWWSLEQSKPRNKP